MTVTLAVAVGPFLSMFLIVCEISFIDASQLTGAWYERVPSPSNIADFHLEVCTSGRVSWLVELVKLTSF